MEFSRLQEMISAITKNKLKDVDVIGLSQGSNTKTEQLYEGISKGKFNSDDEAAAALFDTNAKDVKYKRLRQRLIRQLINSTFFIDINQPMFSEYSYAEQNCYRDFIAALILHNRYATQAGHELMMQTLEQAAKWELTHLCAELTWYLRKNFLASSEDRAARVKFTQLNQLYEYKRSWEAKSADYFENIIDHFFSNQQPPMNELFEVARKYYEELSREANQIDTSLYHYHTKYIGIIMHMAANDFRQAIDLADHLLKIFEERRNINRARVFGIMIQKLVCYVQLRETDSADCRETLEKSYATVEPHTFNWFKLQSMGMYLAFHTRNYRRALDLYLETTSDKNFHRFSGRIQDDWRLHNGYLHLLAQLGVLPVEEVEAAGGPFRLAKFVNDFETIFRDKDGMNIPVVFLPILYNLAIGNNEELGRSFEALEKYRQRYLNNETNRRSATFLKILLALAERPYDQAGADRKIEKELAVLRELRPESDRQLFFVEMVPYEHLLELLKVSVS